MSLSNPGQGSDSSDWGTIYAPGGEHSLLSIERARSTAWSEVDEAAYLTRVREKAAGMAKDMLERAAAEAGSIREQARQEGYAKGLEEAEAELESFRTGMADSVSGVLSAIEGQCSAIFAEWRGDLVALVRMAVEKGLARELSEERAATLEGLLPEAVAQLEKRRELVIRVHPDDEPVIADIVGVTKDRYPDVASWRVRGDASITPGGLVVESETSLADGRVESRMAVIEEIMDRLSLPAGP